MLTIDLHDEADGFLSCDNLIPTLISQGVEHYARIGTLFQSLNLRCRQAFITTDVASLLLQVSSVKEFFRDVLSLCMREANLILIKDLSPTVSCARNKKS